MELFFFVGMSLIISCRTSMSCQVAVSFSLSQTILRVFVHSSKVWISRGTGSFENLSRIYPEVWENFYLCKLLPLVEIKSRFFWEELSSSINFSLLCFFCHFEWEKFQFHQKSGQEIYVRLAFWGVQCTLKKSPFTEDFLVWQQLEGFIAFSSLGFHVLSVLWRCLSLAGMTTRKCWETGSPFPGSRIWEKRNKEVNVSTSVSSAPGSPPDFCTIPTELCVGISHCLKDQIWSCC